jgi:peptide/nickel transport system substrate-binding protein
MANEQAPWIFLNRQYSVYGKTERIDWQARRDERIDAYAISPTSGGNDVTITQSQMDSGLDPHDHRETPTDNVVLQAYEGLLSRDRQGRVQATLATDWGREEEGRVRFSLRSGVSFHSGDSLTKQDVAFSVNRIVDEEVGGLVSPQSDQLAGVTGAEVVDGNSAVDVMSDGLNPIVFSLFASYCDIVNRSWIESNEGSYINRNMDGTGPFQLDTYEQDVRVVFESYGDYWDDEADIEQLTINAAGESSTRVNRLLNGEADITVNVPPQEVSRVRNNGSTSLSAVPSTRVIFNALRHDVEPFSDPTFRQALNYAVDLEGIVQNVLQTFGDATGQPTLEGFVGYNGDLDPYPYDPDMAEQLVEESGHAGAEITLNTPVGRYLKDVEIAQAVANQVNELENVTAELEQREFSALVSEITTGNIEDKPPWYLIGWGNATFDASQTIIPLLTTGGALTTYSNEEFDRLMEQAQSMPNSEQ